METENTTNKEFIEHNPMVAKIMTPEINAFTKIALRDYSDEQRTEEATKVADVLYRLLQKKRIVYQAGQHEIHVDLLLCAAFLHNIYYNGEVPCTRIQDLYKARQMLKQAAIECNVRESLSEMIFDVIEGQLGEDTPVKGSRPNPNTPQEMFALAVWMVKELPKKQEEALQ